MLLKVIVTLLLISGIMMAKVSKYCRVKPRGYGTCLMTNYVFYYSTSFGKCLMIKLKCVVLGFNAYDTKIACENTCIYAKKIQKRPTRKPTRKPTTVPPSRKTVPPHKDDFIYNLEDYINGKPVSNETIDYIDYMDMEYEESTTDKSISNKTSDHTENGYMKKENKYSTTDRSVLNVTDDYREYDYIEKENKKKTSVLNETVDYTEYDYMDKDKSN